MTDEETVTEIAAWRATEAEFKDRLNDADPGKVEHARWMLRQCEQAIAELSLRQYQIGRARR